MRSRALFGAVIFLVISFMVQNLQGAKGESTPGLSVRQQVDSEIFNLEKNLKAAKKRDDRWKFLEKSEATIQNLRAKNGRQFVQDEIDMDFLMNSLKEIPRRAQFKANQCSHYRAQILANYDPQGDPDAQSGDGNPSGNPAVAKALHILSLLCQ